MPDGKIVIDTELKTQKFENQIKDVERKLNTQKATLEAISKSNAYERQSESIRKYGVEIEKTTNKLNKLKSMQLAENLKNVKNIQYDQNALFSQNLSVKRTGLVGTTSGIDTKNLTFVADNVKDLKEAFPEIEKKGKNSAENIDSSFKKVGSSLKKFGLSLFSVGSIFALVSKASSAYLSQNTELANKLQSVWVGLGSFLAPIIETISDALLKALGYLNVFIKALTGVDFIARANAKALEKQASAQKKLNQETQRYDFDVVRTQQQQTGSSGGIGGASGLIDIPELDEKLVKKLQDLAYWLKENWGWIKLVGEVLLVTFGIAKISKVLKGISSLIGSAGVGLTGLSTLLMGLATVFVITIAIKGWAEVFDQVEKLNDALEQNNSHMESNTKSAKASTDEWMERYKAGVLNEEQIERHNRGIQEQIEYLELLYEQTENNKDIVGELTGKNDELRKRQQELSNEMMVLIKHEEELFKQGGLNSEQTVKYAQHLRDQITIQEELGKDTSELRKKYEELTSTTYYIKAKAVLEDEMTPKIENIMLNMKSRMNSVLSMLGSTRQFATGGIVTQPTRALIGEAGYPEAVVPMTDSYLSTLANEIARFGGGGSQPVNIYLDGRLIQRQVANKERQVSFSKNG